MRAPPSEAQRLRARAGRIFTLAAAGEKQRALQATNDAVGVLKDPVPISSGTLATECWTRGRAERHGDRGSIDRGDRRHAQTDPIAGGWHRRRQGRALPLPMRRRDRSG